MTRATGAMDGVRATIAHAQGVPYEALEAGSELGSVRWTVSDRVVAEWTAIREANGPDLARWTRRGRVPEGLAFVYVLRALMTLGVIPPGGVLARQSLRYLRDVSLGSDLDVSMRCGEKSMRKGRPFVVLKTRVEADGAVAIEIDKHVLWPSEQPVRLAPLEGPGTPPSPACPLVVSQAAVERYAELSLDRNPIHLDPGFARGGPFGTLVVHGVIPAGLLVESVASSLPDNSLAGYECAVRFLKPLRPGEGFRIDAAPGVASWRCVSAGGDDLVIAEISSLGATDAR